MDRNSFVSQHCLGCALYLPKNKMGTLGGVFRSSDCEALFVNVLTTSAQTAVFPACIIHPLLK